LKSLLFRERRWTDLAIRLDSQRSVAIQLQ
jgi:hypothetical protein